MTHIHELTVEELVNKIKEKALKPSEVVNAYYEKIEKDEDKVNSFITITKEEALERAKELDALQDEDKMDGALFGVPFGIKDNFNTKDVLTTCASQMLENFYPIHTATSVEKLESSNSVSLGKLNMDEFAMGSTTESSFYKVTANPWNLNHVPGGSSGGSAAAVAAGFVPYALGTDTGGSIRQPASYCGVVGMKPTYGRVSRFGVVAFGSSFDTIGPITKTVKDNALVLEQMAGQDVRDSTSANKEADFLSTIDQDLSGKKIALPKEFLDERTDEDVKKAVQEAVKVFESLGATVEEVSLPNIKYGVSAYYLIASSEASSNLARFDGIRYGYRAENPKSLDELYMKTRSEGFGEEVKRRILLGTYVLGSGHYDEYFVQAQRMRRVFIEDFKQLFETYDLIIGPTTTGVAPKLKGGTQNSEVDDVESLLNDVLTIPANMTGIPAMSIPCGKSEEGLPIGLQILADHYNEAAIYNAAYKFEEKYNLHDELNNLKMEVK